MLTSSQCIRLVCAIPLQDTGSGLRLPIDHHAGKEARPHSALLPPFVWITVVFQTDRFSLEEKLEHG
jgi:hypothetical protein